VIYTDLVEQVAYRMHVPRWASLPLSGEGAAKHGGRANRPGIAALYLALEAETALAEYRQLSPLLPPGTLVTYQVTVSRVVDFRSGYEGEPWDPLWESFGEDWRTLWFDRRIEPPSWVLGDNVLAQHGQGILFRSILTESGTNLVLYPNQFGADDEIVVHDPQAQLPHNQESWQ